MKQTRSLKAFFPYFPPLAQSSAPSPLLAWADRQRQRAALARLEDRMLDDIGVTRGQANTEARRRD